MDYECSLACVCNYMLLYNKRDIAHRSNNSNYICNSVASKLSNRFQVSSKFQRHRKVSNELNATCNIFCNSIYFIRIKCIGSELQCIIKLETLVAKERRMST
jgi:hypothetical protein